MKNNFTHTHPQGSSKVPAADTGGLPAAGEPTRWRTQAGFALRAGVILLCGLVLFFLGSTSGSRGRECFLEDRFVDNFEIAGLRFCKNSMASCLFKALQEQKGQVNKKAVFYSCFSDYKSPFCQLC